MQWLSIAVKAAYPVVAVTGHPSVPLIFAAADPGGGLSSADIIQGITTTSAATVLGAVFWLFINGRLHSDSEISALRAENARILAEKTAELHRIIADKERAETQRDEALRIGQSQVPILQNFTQVTAALLPILQKFVWEQEDRGGRDGRRG